MPRTPGIGEQEARLLLDFDYYDETERLFETKSILEALSRFNDVEYRMFRWAVLDPLLEELGPRESHE